MNGLRTPTEDAVQPLGQQFGGGESADARPCLSSKLGVLEKHRLQANLSGNVARALDEPGNSEVVGLTEKEFAQTGGQLVR